MKTILFFFLLGLLAIPTGATARNTTDERPATVTLTATQVISAIDIENAIHQATNQGQRPGVVILDGSQGPFVFDHPDRAINLFYSNVTLRGKNNPVFPNTDGIYIDDGPYNNLVIEGLALDCSNDCLGMAGEHHRVTVRNNLFRAGGMGISANRGSRWTISNNIILAKNFGVHLIRCNGAVVSNNTLSAQIGVVAEGASNSQIDNNILSNLWQGVLLNGAAYRNQVRQNRIVGAGAAGIALEAGVSGNRIRDNQVVCAFNQPCLTVDASPETLAANAISRNRP